MPLLLTGLTLTVFALALKILLDKIVTGVLLLQQEKSSLERLAIQSALTLQAMATENDKMEKQSKMIVNSLQVSRSLVERLQDPEWMKNFENGRDSAKWN